VTKEMKKIHLRIVLRLLVLSLIVCLVITPCVLAADNETGKSNASTDDLVLTPGGYRPESEVHAINPGESLRLTNEGYLQKIGTSGEVLEDYGIITPGIRNVSIGANVEQPLAKGCITNASSARPAGTLIDFLETFKKIVYERVVTLLR
jgi:hypothetical protein